MGKVKKIRIFGRKNGTGFSRRLDAALRNVI